MRRSQREISNIGHPDLNIGYPDLGMGHPDLNSEHPKWNPGHAMLRSGCAGLNPGCLGQENGDADLDFEHPDRDTGCSGSDIERPDRRHGYPNPMPECSDPKPGRGIANCAPSCRCAIPAFGNKRTNALRDVAGRRASGRAGVPGRVLHPAKHIRASPLCAAMPGDVRRVPHRPRALRRPAFQAWSSAVVMA